MYELNIFSENKESLEKFLKRFYGENFNLSIADNNDKYDLGVWISIDKNIFINITELNLDKIIRYLYERYPY